MKLGKLRERDEVQITNSLHVQLTDTYLNIRKDLSATLNKC